MNNNIKITQTKSSIGRHPRHKATLLSLGLHYPHHSVVHLDTPSIRGMINKVSYMVKVEELINVS